MMGGCFDGSTGNNRYACLSPPKCSVVCPPNTFARLFSPPAAWRGNAHAARSAQDKWHYRFTPAIASSTAHTLPVSSSA